MGEKLSFTVDNAEILKEDPDSSFSLISLDFFADGANGNDTYVSKDTLLRTADTIKKVPLMWKYDAILDDAYTHYPEQIACGFIP